MLCRAQYIEIRCQLGVTSACAATEFVVTQNETLTIVFVGNFVPGWSNVDVESIILRHPPLPFFVAEVFTAFPNLRHMHLFQGTHLNIQNGSFENARRLESLEISGSHVVLSDFALTGAGNLTVIQIADCETLSIGEFAFAGLQSLNTLLIFRSNLHRLHENTFGSLASLERFQLHQSHVETIPSNLFANNTQLRYIVMVINPINEIGRSFINHLGQLEVLDLGGNICVSNGWSNVRQNLEEIHRVLAPCYSNFDELPRQFTLEVHGSLVIRDQNGNVVVRL